MSEAQSASVEHGSGEQKRTGVLGAVALQSESGAQPMSVVGSDPDLHSQFFGHTWSPHVSAWAVRLTASGDRAASKETLTRTQERRVGIRGKSAAGDVPAPKLRAFWPFSALPSLPRADILA